MSKFSKSTHKPLAPSQSLTAGKGTYLISTSYNYVAGAINNWAPIFIARQMHNIITKVEAPRRFLLHFSSQIILSLATNYVSLKLKENLYSQFSQMDNYIFKTLADENATEQDLTKFYGTIYAIAPVLVTCIAFDIISGYVINRYQNWYQRGLVDKISSVIWASQSSVELVNTAGMDSIIRNSREDIFMFTSSGMQLILSFVNGLQNFIFSINGLLSFSSPIKFLYNIPDFLVLSAAYSLITNKISSLFTKKISKLDQKLTSEWTAAESVFSSDFSNIKPIFSSGTQLAIADRHQKLRDDARDTVDRRIIWQSLYKTWSTCHSYLNMIYKNLVIGVKIFSKQIAPDQIHTASLHFSNVDEFISWSASNQRPVQEFSNVSQRLRMFFDAKGKIESRPVNLDFKYKGRDITLSNLRLEIFDLEKTSRAPRQLLDIKEQTFTAGRRYVISGESGSGKSSLLSKINKSLYDGITATGTISFPASCYGNRRMMLTQDDHFPLCSSLFDYLQMPYNMHELPHERKKQSISIQAKAAFITKAKALLNEAKLDPAETVSGGLVERLEETNPNWKSTLSGEQRKKIKLVWAILNQPQVLLLDEVFAGLDPASIQIIQSMLVKHLPETLLIAVEHKPNSINCPVHNHLGQTQPFFQEALVLKDKQLTETGVFGSMSTFSHPDVRSRQSSFACQYGRTRGKGGKSGRRDFVTALADERKKGKSSTVAFP